jgi:hypothetical protein
MKIILLSLLATLATGCAGIKQKSVNLESDPPGARVFLSLGATAKQAAKNRSYLGQTPCTATIETDRKGYFKVPERAWVSGYVSGTVTFTAEPPSGATNQRPQTITYRGPSDYAEGDKVPSAVFFDMTK